MGFFDGCLVFSNGNDTGVTKYKHCGAGCGDYGPNGGGTPVNSLDRCCQAHDRCWENFGKDDCECDRLLGICTNNATDSPGWESVATWAALKNCTKH